MTPTEQYLKWKRGSSAVGCQFARFLAVNSKEHGQVVEVVGQVAARSIANEIERLVSKHVAAPATNALTLLFPDLADPAILVAIALDLKQRSTWQVTHWLEPSTPVGRVVAFGMARDVPLASGANVPSEALVLGPFDIFPATRKAPVTALEIFVGIPLQLDPKKGTPTVKANLAHIAVAPPLTQAQFGNVWKGSEKARLASLGGVNDHRARAKVAFVVPEALARALGCAP